MNIRQAFTYCPRCGSRFQPTRSYLDCKQCGLHFYLNPKPCTSVLLQNDQNEYLLVKRAKEPQKGWWDLPGGFIDIGETYESGAKRELLEELGVLIDNLEYINSAHDLYLYQDVTYPVVCANFRGHIANKTTIQPADDVESYSFFKLADIPLDTIAFPSLRQIFIDLQKDNKV